MNTGVANYDRAPENILVKSVFMGSGSRPMLDPGMTDEKEGN
jgi:hypothetical protein